MNAPAPAPPVPATAPGDTSLTAAGVPQRKAWAARLAARYARRQFSRSFDGVFVAGLEATRDLARAQPILLAPTHVSWWDALLLVLLDDALETDGRALMDADNLSRLPFFGALGAVPLHRGRGQRSRMRRDLAFALSTLDRPGRALWVFPQGRQRPVSVRPLGLAPGVQLLARQAQAPVVPVALRYGYREAERPAVVVHFGSPLDGRAPDLLGDLEAALISGLDAGEALLDAPGLVGPAVPEGSPFSPLIAPADVPGDQDPATRALSALTRILTRLGARRRP